MEEPCKHDYWEEMEIGKEIGYCYNCSSCKIRVHCKGCKREYYKKKK